MRGWGWVVLVPTVLPIVSGGCAPEAPPVVYVASEWRTLSGEPVTAAEFNALRQGCSARPVAAQFDREKPVPMPARDNPAYRPGGEGIINARMTGLAAADAPVVPSLVQRKTIRLQPTDECLREKGVVREAPVPLIVPPDGTPPAPPGAPPPLAAPAPPAATAEPLPPLPAGAPPPAMPAPPPPAVEGAPPPAAATPPGPSVIPLDPPPSAPAAQTEPAAPPSREPPVELLKPPV